MKIAFALFAANMVLGHLLQAPEFVRGLLLGLSLFFMIIGLLPENMYSRYRATQTTKMICLKKILKRR